jgi:hypothetical protein
MLGRIAWPVRISVDMIIKIEIFDFYLVNATPGKLPRTILPPQRTFWGAILDVIVGDGPSKR